MTYKLGALVLHGIGDQPPNFADDVIQKISEQVGKQGGNPGDICWKPVHWAPILQHRQEEFWDHLSRSNKFGYKTLRKMVIYTFGDAIAYLQRAHWQEEGDVYDKVHKLVHTKAVELREEIGGDKPLVVVAHSLGTIIMSNYIWDEQHYKEDGSLGLGGNAFEGMKTLAGMYTFGTNIALVSLAYNPVESIKFPPDDLQEHFPNTSPEAVKKAAQWLNFYDKDDILGYPLKSILGYWNNPAVADKPEVNTYADAVTEDYQIDAGHLLQRWNPWSHTGYWTDKKFINPVAQSIADILKLL